MRDRSEYAHAYYQRNRERLVARSREYRHANRDIIQAGVERRRARQQGPGVSAEQWAAIQSAYDGRCAYCGTVGKMTMDHVVPLSKGGAHEPFNVVPACTSCNCRKRTGPPSTLPTVRLMI